MKRFTQALVLSLGLFGCGDDTAAYKDSTDKYLYERLGRGSVEVRIKKYEYRDREGMLLGLYNGNGANRKVSIEFWPGDPAQINERVFIRSDDLEYLECQQDLEAAKTKANIKVR